MSTNTTNNQISRRKQHHIDVCRSDSGKNILSDKMPGFCDVQFVHNALPEISFDEIDTSVDFLGHTISLPLFISCMTGGSEEGMRANRLLAKAAQKAQIPIGLGSIRVLLEDPSRLKDFQIKELAPDVPVLANLSAVQARDVPLPRIADLVKQVEADALVIHLNCGQELFQHGGDRDFRGLEKTIGTLADRLDLPLIVKETGFGIAPALIARLLKLGVSYIDIAGSGGTNWILVEKSCGGPHEEAAAEFSSWGIPTAPLLDATRAFSGKILASGGLRSGMDLAKSLALGAFAGGMALPFIQEAIDGGEEAVCRRIEKILYVLRSVMLLTGCKTVDELRNIPLIKTAQFTQTAQAMSKD